ncbi:MAG: hypothetical protein KJS97_12595 [Alphaproteobacteria bacterium]|nr:hypothetical protein [Alphaproteobacteria bacterium]
MDTRIAPRRRLRPRHRIVAGLLAALTLAGCATTPAVPFRRESLARQISDDASAFNEAYARAVSGQILLNVLRGRERLPRHYLSMSGIQDAPSLRFRESLGIGSVPLGDGASPWGFGSFGAERETQSRPSYALSPLSADTLTRAVFTPTPANIFEHYWDSGWPRDVLMFLLVGRITRITQTPGAPPQIEEFVNEAAGIRNDCAGVVSTGCAFVDVARGLLGEIATRGPAPTPPSATPVCGLIDAYAPREPLRPAAPEKGQSCAPRLVVGDVTYVFTLRSFDDIVYYVGELMRAEGAPEGELRAALNVRAAGLRDGAAPLFRIVEEGAARRDVEGEPRARFAASVIYDGRRWFAGPPVSRTCERVGPGPCADDPRLGDRSSSVLSLLAELLALNQSPEAIRPPSRLIVE